jgi:hypothetical protein
MQDQIYEALNFGQLTWIRQITWSVIIFYFLLKIVIHRKSFLNFNNFFLSISGIPILYILVTVPPYLPWENSFRFLSWCHLVGSVAPWIGSFIYHLFMNLERGERVYYRLLQLDMIGIWISQSFGKSFYYKLDFHVYS